MNADFKNGEKKCCLNSVLIFFINNFVTNFTQIQS